MIFCSPQGMLHHDLTIIDQRQLAGIKRVEFKKQLAQEIASVYRRKVTGKETTDKAALEQGNYTEVQTLQVLQKARSEV